MKNHRKKHLFIVPILALALLCSCAKEETQLGVSDVVITTKDTGNLDFISKTAIDQINEKISKLEIGDFLSEEKLTQLKSAQITPTVSDIQKIDNDTIFFKLNLAKGKNSISFGLYGNMNYMYHENDENEIFAFKILWGNVSVCENEVLVTDLKNIYVLSADRFKQIDKGFDYSSIDAGDNYFIFDALKSDGKIYASFSNPEKEGFIIYNDKGEPLNEIGSSTTRTFAYFSSEPSVNSNTLFNFDKYMDLDICGSLLFSTCYNGTNAMAETQSGEYWPHSYIKTKGSANDKEILILRSGDEDFKYGDYYAVKYENGKACDCITSDLKGLSGAFGDSEYHQKDTPPASFNEADGVFTIYDDYVQQTITVDYNTRLVSVTAQPTKKQLENVILTSKDGKYTLYSGAGYGGGDYSAYGIILFENSTEKLKYLGIIGGMYGGNSDLGFLSNGDVYLQGLDQFMIYDTDMDNQAPIFDMSENFPLGENKKENYTRYLLSVRRDPKTKEYIALYAQIPYNAQGSDLYEDDNHWKYKYQIAFLDSEGKLKNNYEIDEKVILDPFGIVPCYMSVNGNQLTVFAKRKVEVFKGVFDLDNLSYKNLSRYTFK